MNRRFYEARPTKRRATKAEMESRRAALLDIVFDMHPMTVRQAFYQAVVDGTVKKTERGYEQVQNALTYLRRKGQLPYECIVDPTRRQLRPGTFEDPAEAIRVLASSYRKGFWTDADVQIQVWLEKQALEGVLYEVTAELDVPLMVSRGYSSLSFLYEAAAEIKEVGKPTYIYHLGDFDPSGQDAADKIEANLREFAPAVDIHFQRLAVLPEQIHAWSLPTRPTKKSDSRAGNFGTESVELDAIDPRTLRHLVRNAIERHLPPDRVVELRAVEKVEREKLAKLAAEFGRAS